MKLFVLELWGTYVASLGSFDSVIDREYKVIISGKRWVIRVK